MPYYRAWLEGAWRLVLDSRKISRGPDKGKLEVKYRSTASSIKKHRVSKEDLREIQEGTTGTTNKTASGLHSSGGKGKATPPVSGVVAKAGGIRSSKSRSGSNKSVSNGNRSKPSTTKKRRRGRSGRKTRK